MAYFDAFLLLTSRFLLYYNNNRKKFLNIAKIGVRKMAETKHKSYYYTVKRLRLLEHLLDNGFKPAKIIPDPTNPRFKWWLFVNSVELEAVVEEYFNCKQKI